MTGMCPECPNVLKNLWQDMQEVDSFIIIKRKKRKEKREREREEREREREREYHNGILWDTTQGLDSIMNVFVDPMKEVILELLLCHHGHHPLGALKLDLI